MSSNALDEVGSLGSLKKSWGSIYRKSRPGSRNSVGADGESINDFASDPNGRLLRLSRELKNHTFCFSQLRPHLIPKTNGKDRLICVPTVRDRVVQRALLNFLSDHYDKVLANRISYGFLRGRSVKDAVHAACELRTSHPWVLKTDISSFFDRIDRNILEKQFKKLIRERSLHRILTGAMHCEVATPSVSATRRIKRLGIQHGRGVRQGMPLSPFFANVVLHPFDANIIERRLNAVRYADDLIFFANSKSECADIYDFCVSSLSKLDLELPPLTPQSKSVIFAPNEPAEFLGLGISLTSNRYVPRLLNPQHVAIQISLLQLASVKELLARRITLSNLGRAIENRISGYISAYEACENILELEHNLHLIGQKIRRNLYSKELKIPLANLSNDARAFLALDS